jgi:hypothetical protein
MLGRGGSIKRENLITQQLDAYGQLHYVWKCAIAEMLLKCFDIRRFELTKLLGLVRGPPEFGSCYSQGKRGPQRLECWRASFCTRKIADIQMLATEF